MPNSAHAGLTEQQVRSFIDNGFIRVDEAFPADLAKQCRDELWSAIGLSPDRPQDWTQPVIRVPSMASPAFVQAGNTPQLHRAYDQLVGPGRWIAPQGLGTFPIRFPSPDAPGDDGWHVDVSFGDSPDFMEWRANVKSSHRALLMLFLFSDVGPDDAPTRIRTGSHRTIARELLPYGEGGATLRQLSAGGYAVKPALTDLGLLMAFTGVVMKPGKPVSYGKLGAVHWLGLPGNPLSAFIAWQMFGTVLSRCLSGGTAPHSRRRHVVLSRPLRHKFGRCELRLAELSGFDGMGREGVHFDDATHSGRVARLPIADGVILIPSEVENLPEGALVEFQPFCD